MGHLTFLGLVRRESLSCFHCVYRFFQRHHFDRAVLLWPSVEQELRAFLFAHLYRHPQVNRRRHKTTKIIKDLFDLYDANPSLLLSEKGMAEAIDDPVVRAGIVTDTIASMTDKSAIEEHRRQFDLYAID